MKKILVASALALAGASVSPMMAAPALAQAKAIAVADVRVAAAKSQAFATARQQIETTYKAQLDQQETRAQTLQAEVNVLVAKYNEESKKTPQNQTTLQAAAKAVQDKRQAAQAELGQLSAPVDLAYAFVEDQISLRLREAVRAAMTAKRIDLLLGPDAIIQSDPTVDITDAVVTELNRVLPNVSIQPPAGYRPGQLVEQANQQAAAAARAAAPAPAGTAPTTR